MQEATQKYRKLTDYRTKCCYLSLLFSLLIATCASFAFLNGRVFSVLGHSFERHKWSFVLYIVSFSALKMAFSKLSLAKYHCLRKKPYIFHVFNYYRMSLQISFTNSSVQISSCIKAVLHGKICIVRFDDSYLVNIFIQIWKDRTHPIF